MAYCLADGAILDALDPGPNQGWRPWEQRVKEVGPPPLKDSDCAWPLEAAVGPVLESQQGCGLLRGPHPRSHSNAKSVLDPKAPESAYHCFWLQFLPIDHQIPRHGMS